MEFNIFSDVYYHLDTLFCEVLFKSFAHFSIRLPVFFSYWVVRIHITCTQVITDTYTANIFSYYEGLIFSISNCVFWWKRVLVLMPCSSIGFLLCALANMSFWSSLRGTKGKPILRMSIYPCEDEIQALIERKKVKVKVLVIQSCPTLCDPMDCSPPDSSVHGILQARILEKVAILFSRGPSWPWDQTSVSCTAGRFITVWATEEAPWNGKKPIIILPHPQYYFCYLSPWERHAIMKLSVHRFSFKKMETELQKPQRTIRPQIQETQVLE